MADDAAAASWTSHRTDDGQEYFYNSETGETTWERPEGVTIADGETEQSTPQESSAQEAPLQGTGTWTAHQTDDGQEYYYNVETGETTWERPEGVEIHQPEQVASPERQASPGAADGEAMEIDEEAKASKQEVVEEEKEKIVVKVDPVEEAKAALKKPDAILEPGCIRNIQTIVEKEGEEDGVNMATEAISDSYKGNTVICGFLASWLKELKAASSASSADTAVQQKDSGDVASNEVRDIVQNVLYGATKEKFNKEKADEMTSMEKEETLFIDAMIASPRWRNLLIDLATANKDSVLLKYCIRKISDLGHHRELAKRINMTDDFSVFNSTLKAEFTAIGDLISSVASDSDSSMDLREMVDDVKRMCTSASFTYLYAVELLRTLVERAKQEDASSNGKCSLKGASRKWQRLIEELENEMTGGHSASSTMFRKRRLDTALTLSELHQRQRRRPNPSLDNVDEDVDRDENRDSLESALEDLLKRYSRGLPLDDRILNKLLPEDGSDESSNPTGELMIAHPLSIQALLGQLFKPGSARASSMVTRNKCARLIALAVLAADSAVGNGPPPASDSQEESPTEILTGMLLTASQLCELLENMMTFEVISDPTLASDDSSAGRKLSALALRSAPIAQGVILWASEITRGTDFVTSASYPTFAPSILSLSRVLSGKHPFTRSAVLDIALAFLKHSNREISYQKMNDLKLQALRLLIFLLVKGEVCAVLQSVTKRLRQQGTSEIDASLIRYFVGGLLDVMRPPFSLALVRELGPMLMAPKCIEALRSSYFEQDKKTRLSLLVTSMADTLAKENGSCTKEDRAMVSTLRTIYCS